MSRQCRICFAPLGDAETVCTNCGALNALSKESAPVPERPVAPPRNNLVIQVTPPPAADSSKKSVEPETDGKRKCRNCFLPLGDTDTECSNCGTQNPLSKDIAFVHGKPLTHEAALSSHPMNWFKFLIYFWLIASCIVWFVFAVGFLVQMDAQNDLIADYEQQMDKYYSYYSDNEIYHYYSSKRDDAKSLQIWMGLLAVSTTILGIWALVTRSRLANYYHTGPSSFYGYLVGCVIFFVLYGISMGRGGIEMIYWQLFTGGPAAVCNFICLACSKVYFEKRYKMFN